MYVLFFESQCTHTPLELLSFDTKWTLYITFNKYIYQFHIYLRSRFKVKRI